MAEERRDVYMNMVQQRMFYAGARWVVLEAARRFGKTDGGIGPRLWTVAETMPQGSGAFLGTSRKQLFTRTIPAALAALERFYKMKEGVHYGFGRPPKGTPPCIIKPKSYENCLWFANGWLWHTVSLAVFGSVNGMTLNSLIADECKFLPKKKIDEEVMPALSGIVHPLNDSRFSEQNPYYKSTFFCSDASLSSKGNWLSKEEERLDMVVDDGPCKGMTYRQVQEELDSYANKVIHYNEMLRSAKKDGHRVIVVSDDEKEIITALMQSIERRDGQFKIIPRQYKDLKAICEYCANYKLVDQDVLDLLYNYHFLLTDEEHYEMMAIQGSKKYQKRINELRCNCFYFVRASSLDNIDILGEDYIRQMRLSLPPLVFAVSILNLKNVRPSDGFYFNLDIENVHGYIVDECPAIEQSITIKKSTTVTGGTAYQGEYETPDFQMLEGIRDCRLDGDIVDSEPLHIACDYNNLINWVCVGQMYRRDGQECINLINSMFVKDGGMIQDLMREFNRYYIPHKQKNKTVYYYYDHTAKFKIYSVAGSVDIKDTVIGELEKYGWDVQPIDCGQTWEHEARYKDINEALGGYSYPGVRINREQNEALIMALEMAGVEMGYRGFRKSKQGEKLSVEAEGATPAELRTDATDAFDNLIIGIRHYRYSMSGMCLPRR